MNLKKEFQELKNKNIENILDSLYIEKNELEMKIYILEVINVINSLKEIIKSENVLRQNVQYVEFHKENDYDLGHTLKVSFFNGEKIKKDENENEINQINELFESFSINEFFANPTLMPNQIFLLKIDEVNKLYDLLLNNELKSIMNAALLDNELPINELKDLKKNKI